MNPLRIFSSSVQKELELERAAVAGLISTRYRVVIVESSATNFLRS